jgi:hypothetical protein
MSTIYGAILFQDATGNNPSGQSSEVWKIQGTGSLQDSKRACEGSQRRARLESLQYSLDHPRVTPPKSQFSKKNKNKK